MTDKELLILGTRGIPGAHGGFERFAEDLSLFLVQREWGVTVYCQGEHAERVVDSWKGVRRVTIPVRLPGVLGTIEFDFLSTMDALRRSGVVLILGYNTAVFSIFYKLAGRHSLMNMDGLEWMRDKWSFLARGWLYLNERVGCLVSDHLIADHPEIAAHLQTRVSRKKITTIPYGARAIQDCDDTVLESHNLRHSEFSLVVARPEPENSILTIVEAFSKRKRGHTLVVLGDYSSELTDYQKEVINASSDEVKFIGAIYDLKEVSALRRGSRYYFHGHQVGGTNPSLVEALGASCAVIAHDNRFNRWVAGDAAFFFSDQSHLEDLLIEILDCSLSVEKLRNNAYRRHSENFELDNILEQYEALIERLK